MSAYDDRYPAGARKEHLDGKPMALPVGFRRPPSLIDQMRSMIRNELSEAANRGGRETFEEANDFDVPDDPDDPSTPWEVAADGDAEVAQGLDDARQARAARAAGWSPPTAATAHEEWARANGWIAPSSKAGIDPAQPAPASAAGKTGGNPASSPEASSHSPST